jgi:hypothetical protein
VLQAETLSGIFAAILFCSTGMLANEINQSSLESAEFVGAANCRSSSCHGGAGPKREQYLVWSRQDFHAKSFAILTSARSARIIETIGGGEASTNARCTVCHSPFQTMAPTRLASTAHPDEGVSCESCHGAARSWLRGHTRPDWTYATRVTAGMRDLRSLYVRANSCVACHQNIDNELLKAGLPTMVFELDSQSIDEPKHWRDDPWIGSRAWLTGQAVALREATWRWRTDPISAPDMQATSSALAWLLEKVTTMAPGLPQVSEPNYSALDSLQRQADELARGAATWNLDINSAMSMLRGLSSTEAEFIGPTASIETLFYRARRLVLALDRLSAAINENQGAQFKIDKELKALREDVRSRENFAPVHFVGHLRNFRSKL